MKVLVVALALWQKTRSRIGLALASALAVGSCLRWMAGPDAHELQRLEQEIAAMAQQLVPPVGAAVAEPGMSGGFSAEDWPAQADSAVVWAAVQQSLQAWGFQVQSLRPQAADAANTGNALAEQRVALRLQGNWADWRGFEQAMARQAPWWLAQHVLVQPAGQVASEVIIDVQARVGWRPPGWAGTAAWAWRAAEPLRSVTTPSLWRLGAGPRTVDGPAASATTARSGQPLRLMGIWQQGGRAHAVLDLGSARMNVTAGQHVGREGYRVRSVSAAAVELAPLVPGAPLLHLRLEEAP